MSFSLKKEQTPSCAHFNRSFAIIPAITAGIKDSTNPVAIIGLLFLIMFVVHLSHQKNYVFLAANVFIATLGLMTLLFTIGVFDSFLSSVFTQAALQSIFFILGSLYIILGLVSLYDWWLVTKYGAANKVLIRWPKISLNVSSEGYKGRVILSAVLCGIIVSVLETIWPPNFSLGVMYAGLVMPGQRLLTLIAFCFYSIAFVFPLILAVIILSYLFKAQNFKGWMKNSLSKVKIISAAIFLSIGLSILYIFF